MNVQGNCRFEAGCGAFRAALRTVWLLFLALCLLQPVAFAQQPIAAPPTEGTAAVEADAENVGPNCSQPLPGQTARLVGDDEIFLLYRDGATPRYLRDKVINDANGTLTSVRDKSWSSIAKLGENWWLSAAAGDLNGTSDNARKAQLIAAFKNKDEQIAAISDPFSSAADNDWWAVMGGRTDGGNLKDVSVATGNLDSSSDGSDEIALAFRDDAEDYHVMVLDGKSDGTILDADDRQAIDKWEDHSPGNERGNTYHYSVATGDLNGDGFDNEIVTVFKDSGKDLQVVVLRPTLPRPPATTGGTADIIFYWDSYTGNPKIDTIASDCTTSWDNKRPIDVTTGDLDADQKDEVIVAARNGHCDDGYITLLVFDFLPENATTHALSINTSVPVVNINHDPADKYAESAPTISISAADLDGDGYDEIAMGYNVQWCGYDHDDRHWQQSLVTYDYHVKNSPEWTKHCSSPITNPFQLPCLVARQDRSHQWWSGSKSFGIFTSEAGPQALVSVATGDTDQDGMYEIAMARLNPDSGAVEVRNFDADDAAANRLAQRGNTLTVDLHPSSGDLIWEFALAMGDYDGDSRWGTYANTCFEKKEAQVQAVLHAPPFWPEGRGQNGCDNDYRTMAGLGVNVVDGGGTSQTLETTTGGSATLGFKIKGITAAFGREWERSVASTKSQLTTTTKGVNTETTPPLSTDWASGDLPDWEGVLGVETGYWCYNYTEPELGTIPVCIPRQELTSHVATTMEWWYSDEEGKGQETYEDSWVPLGMNLAEDTADPPYMIQREAWQSSTWTDETPPGDAKRSVDGKTDGNYYNGSCSHTTNDLYAYWQLDMGGLQWMDAVRIWNRTDSLYAQNRLKNFWVFVTDKLTWPSNDPNVLKTHPDVTFKRYVTGPVGENITIPVNGYGRMLRIQYDHQDFLNLCEVQVYGMPGTPDQWPKAVTPSSITAATKPFTLTWRNNRQQAVADGTLHLVWDSATFQTGPGKKDIGFDLGTATSSEYVVESGQSQKLKVGLETKVKKERSAGIGQKTANTTTWEKSIEFSGVAQGFEGASAPSILTYYWAPYVWLQEETPAGGGVQQFLVLDYFVPTANAITNPVTEPDLCPGGVSGSLAPEAPLIDCPTHPDPDTWYSSNTATFTWDQPGGDPATVTDYHWALDQSPDTIPAGLHLGLTTSKTYEGLADGIWYLHVRAMDETGAWGEAGQRMIHVDATPPQVSLAVDPSNPTGNGDWYVTPVSVAVIADDAGGSGVQSVEVSTDGLTWQPYLAPLGLSADTPGTTVYARATDAVGNLSEPVSTTVKIDSTPPDSHVPGGVGPGTWVAEVRTNSAGNDELVLAGAIADNASGRATMVLEEEGLDWNASAQIGSWHPFPNPAIEVNWFYTATNTLGAGYHIFTGRAVDTAGNQETAYTIGEVKWFPKASPDLGGSSVTALPATARPGEEILFTLVARNAGFQEAHVAIAATLPAGVEPVLEVLPAGVVYDPATRTLTWPARLMWPGWFERRSFLAAVDAGLDATSLDLQATFHAFWPNTDLLPEAERQQFLDREQTVVATATVAVDPNLPPDADVTPPLAALVQPHRQQVVGPEVSLDILAWPDASRMYLREWTPDPVTGDWTVAQDSGWIDYSPTYTWRLSAGQGVKYLGVWLADEAGNVSTLNEHSLIFVNRMDAGQALAGGQRIQYRGLLQGGEFVGGVLKTVSGDPDVYLWQPRNAFWPDRAANGTNLPGQVETYSHAFAPEPGRYLLEVQAVGDSEYELSPAGQEAEMAAAGRAALEKARPEHPLTISDPLSAGQLGPEVRLGFKLYLPVLFKTD
jgi:hypothetical protein